MVLLLQNTCAYIVSDYKYSNEWLTWDVQALKIVLYLYFILKIITE
jgi:hypothetical protein